MEVPIPYWSNSRKITVESSNVSILDTLSLSNSSVAVSTSNKTIKIFNYESGSLYCQFTQHNDRISDMAKCNSQPNIFCSVGEDARLCFWDLRQKNSWKVIHSEKKLFSVDISSDFKHVAAGSGKDCYVWNIDTGKRIGKYEEIQQRISQTKFHPKTNLIYTGSYDGLVCIFDPSLGDTEDEAYISALSGEQGISHMGFFGDENEFLWATTGNESLSFWELTNESQLSLFDDARKTLSSTSNIDIDFLINCIYDKNNKILYLFTGTQDGSISAFSTIDSKNINFVGTFPNNLHCDSVRSVSASHSMNVLITGGDDGVIGIWNKNDNVNYSKGKQSKHLKPFDPLSQ